MYSIQRRDKTSYHYSLSKLILYHLWYLLEILYNYRWVIPLAAQYCIQAAVMYRLPVEAYTLLVEMFGTGIKMESSVKSVATFLPFEPPYNQVIKSFGSKWLKTIFTNQDSCSYQLQLLLQALFEWSPLMHMSFISLCVAGSNILVWMTPQVMSNSLKICT